MKRLIGIIGMAVMVVLLLGFVFGTHGFGPTTPASGSVVFPESLRHAAGPEAMRDSCIPPTPFDLPTRWPAVC